MTSPISRAVTKDILDPTVWKYAAYSLFLAAGALIWVGHVVIDRAVHAGMQALSPERWIPDSVSFAVPLASFIVSLGLFSLAWPLMASAFLPAMTFFQVLLAEPFTKQFCSRNYPGLTAESSSTWRNLLVFFKWTSLKAIVFLVFLPLFHVPGLGWGLHLILVSAWITLIYRDITTNRFLLTKPARRRAAARVNLVGMVALGSVANFFVVWLVGVLSLSIPHFRHGFIIGGAAFVILGNYLMITEFLRASAEFAKKDMFATDTEDNVGSLED